MKTTKPGTQNPRYPYRHPHATGNVFGRFPGKQDSSWMRFVRPPDPRLF